MENIVRGYSDEELRDNLSVSLDELEMGNDIADELMEKYVNINKEDKDEF